MRVVDLTTVHSLLLAFEDLNTIWGVKASHAARQGNSVSLENMSLLPTNRLGHNDLTRTRSVDEAIAHETLLHDAWLSLREPLVISDCFNTARLCTTLSAQVLRVRVWPSFSWFRLWNAIMLKYFACISVIGHVFLGKLNSRWYGRNQRLLSLSIDNFKVIKDILESFSVILNLLKSKNSV